MSDPTRFAISQITQHLRDRVAVPEDVEALYWNELRKLLCPPVLIRIEDFPAYSSDVMIDSAYRRTFESLPIERQQELRHFETRVLHCILRAYESKKLSPEESTFLIPELLRSSLRHWGTKTDRSYRRTVAQWKK